MRPAATLVSNPDPVFVGVKDNGVTRIRTFLHICMKEGEVDLKEGFILLKKNMLNIKTSSSFSAL